MLISLSKPKLFNSERGFLDFSVFSFLLGAATLYFIFNALGRIDNGSELQPVHPQYAAATPSFDPTSSLERFGGNLGVREAVDSAHQSYGSALEAYTSAAETAGEAYDSARAGAKSMAALAGDAMDDFADLQHAALSDIKKLGSQASSFSASDLGLGGKGGRSGLRLSRSRRS